jgi:glutamate 5-kinase
MEDRKKLIDKKKVVVKVGTSTLTHSNGTLNYPRIEKLVMVLCEMRKQGRNVLLVTSGAIAVGAGKLGLKERPSQLAKKQALAAIGHILTIIIKM